MSKLKQSKKSEEPRDRISLHPTLSMATKIRETSHKMGLTVNSFLELMLNEYFKKHKK